MSDNSIDEQIADMFIRADRLESEANLLRYDAFKLAQERAVAEEREACARVAEQCSGGDSEMSTRHLIAARIRARGAR